MGKMIPIAALRQLPIVASVLRAPFIVALVILVLIVAIYGLLEPGVLTLDEFNLTTASAMTLILAATGQTIVLIRGGIDLSIGGIISLGTVIAATRFTDDPATVATWTVLILALGFGAGALNGLIISVMKLQPFLVTLAGWSIFTGIALSILPTDGGSVPPWWTNFGYSQVLGLSGPVWVLLALAIFWYWFRATRLGIVIQATGSNERSAMLSGVSVTWVNVATYGISGLFAAMAALYLTTLTGTGSPLIGRDYILPSVAAAVVGGVSLFGGRGHLVGTILGAFILTIIGDLVFALRVSSYWQPVMGGVVLLVAVLGSSLTEKFGRNK
jgi:ribose transport system permease protein